MLSALLLILSASPTQAECAPLPGWEAVAEQAEGKYLIFGELHGSEQSPQMVAEYACAVSPDASVLVAVELSSRSNEGLQRAWNAPVGEFRGTLLAEVEEFANRNDGVASVAMVEMLERLHRLKSAGRSISVVAFNGAKDEDQIRRFADLPGQEPHESAQAENIRSAAEAGGFDHVVVLVGNLHASKTPMNFGGPQWRPMAMILAESADVLTLNMAYSGGSSWSCQLADGVVREPGKPISSDQIECKARPLVDAPAYGERQFRLDQETDARYDGLYVLGEISASPPVGQQ